MKLLLVLWFFAATPQIAETPQTPGGIGAIPGAGQAPGVTPGLTLGAPPRPLAAPHLPGGWSTATARAGLLPIPVPPTRSGARPEADDEAAGPHLPNTSPDLPRAAADTLARRPLGERALVASLPPRGAANGVPGPWELDAAIARRAGGEAIQQSPAARALAGTLRFLALPGTLLLAGSLYGYGELADRPDLSAYGMHTGQAVVAAGVATLAGKVIVGRARPHDNPDDPTDFGLGRGFLGDRYQSFPSAHTAAAFAAAAVLGSELSDRHAGASAWLSPLLYGTAALAGATRIYHNEHWATDVVAGAVIGTAAGRGTAAYHRR